MEEKHNSTHPTQPEKTEGIPAITKETFTPPVIILLLVLAAFVVGGIVFFLAKNTAPSSLPSTSTNPPATSVPDTVEWKTYTNTEAGFSLQYPSSVLLDAQTQSATQSILFVSAQKLSDIPEELPSLMGRTDALKQKAALEKGEGENLVKIGSLNGQVGMTLSQFEICSVILNRSLTFYPSDYRVIISLSGPKDAIMNSMPEFFTVDPANCGTNRMWNQDKMGTFESTLAQKKGNGAAQEWYDTFDAIIKTITLTTSVSTTAAATNTVTSDWLTYKNAANGFEISYPKSYKALGGKNDLSGYPNGVVLLYSGGQAYDVVVEVWNTEAEYKEKYATMMSDVTVIKSNGRFITLLNSTHQPENDQIIASFKLLGQ